jgi:hypothetical protein
VEPEELVSETGQVVDDDVLEELRDEIDEDESEDDD